MSDDFPYTDYTSENAARIAEVCCAAGRAEWIAGFLRAHAHVDDVLAKLQSLAPAAPASAPAATKPAPDQAQELLAAAAARFAAQRAA